MLDHNRVIIDKAVKVMLIYLRVDLGDTLKELEDTRGCHAKFGFFERLYAQQLSAAEHATGDDGQVIQHIAYTLITYMYFVGTSLFVEKSAYYVNVVYLRHFVNLEQIYE